MRSRRKLAAPSPPGGGPLRLARARRLRHAGRRDAGADRVEWEFHAHRLDPPAPRLEHRDEQRAAVDPDAPQLRVSRLERDQVAMDVA